MNAIVAVNSDWGIGLDGKQQNVVPEDRRHFRLLTEGGVVIVGRKTFESFPAPLPRRVNIILTRNRDYLRDGALIAHSVGDVLAMIGGYDTGKVFVVGGESVYRQLMPYCAKAYVTKIELAPPSDTFFPNLDIMPDWTRELDAVSMETETGIR